MKSEIEKKQGKKKRERTEQFAGSNPWLGPASHPSWPSRPALLVADPGAGRRALYTRSLSVCAPLRAGPFCQPLHHDTLLFAFDRRVRPLGRVHTGFSTIGSSPLTELLRTREHRSPRSLGVRPCAPWSGILEANTRIRQNIRNMYVGFPSARGRYLARIARWTQALAKDPSYDVGRPGHPFVHR